MNLDEIIRKVTSGEIPAGAMGGGGILLLLLAVKTARGFIKFLFVFAAFALLAGAVCWHFRHQH